MFWTHIFKHAAAAKSLQSCLTLCDPIDGSPPGSPVPGILQAKNTGVGCHFLLQCMKVKSESEVAQSCPTLATPWTAAYQIPPSMGFSRQQYWSGVPLPFRFKREAAIKHVIKMSFENLQDWVRILPHSFTNNNNHLYDLRWVT